MMDGGAMMGPGGNMGPGNNMGPPPLPPNSMGPGFPQPCAPYQDPIQQQQQQQQQQQLQSAQRRFLAAHERGFSRPLPYQRDRARLQTSAQPSPGEGQRGQGEAWEAHQGGGGRVHLWHA